jgi:hypothetical protein
MKKKWQRNKFSKYNNRHAFKQNIKRLEYKEWKRKKNFHEINMPEKRRHIEREGYNIVSMPSDFRFLSNTVDILKKIELVRKNYNQKKATFIELNQVKEIDAGSISVLLSVMIEFSLHKIKFNGDFPTDLSAKKILIESGFLKELYKDNVSKSIYEKDSNFVIGVDKIITVPRKSVVPSVIKDFSDLVSGKLWDNKKVSKGLHRVLVELMHNTENHADSERRGTLPWWVTVSFDKTEKKFRFAFLDYGIGIFDSLKIKYPSSKFKFLDTILQLYGNNDNGNILRGILKGELHRTVTGKENRGKGLPGIYKTLERNQISNLVIISNNVYADVDNDKFIINKFNFKGTFVSWEINFESEAPKWKS